MVIFYIFWVGAVTLVLWGTVSLLTMLSLSFHAYTNLFIRDKEKLSQFVIAHRGPVKGVLFFSGLVYIEGGDTKIVYFLSSAVSVIMPTISIFLLNLPNTPNIVFFWVALGISVFNLASYWGAKHDMRMWNFSV